MGINKVSITLVHLNKSIEEIIIRRDKRYTSVDTGYQCGRTYRIAFEPWVYPQLFIKIMFNLHYIGLPLYSV